MRSLLDRRQRYSWRLATRGESYMRLYYDSINRSGAPSALRKVFYLLTTAMVATVAEG
jgi:hypothetical protein